MMKLCRTKVKHDLLAGQRVCARKGHGAEVFQIIGRFRIQHGAQSRITDDVLRLSVMMEARSSFFVLVLATFNTGTLTKPSKHTAK